MSKRIITFGTFDVFHIGHINILERCATLGNELIVGVSSDQLNFNKKGRMPIYDEASRIKIIKSLKFVSDVFVEHSLELKRKYIQHYNADILAMGDDWFGKFDHLNDLCDVIYFPRTPSISTTEIIEITKKL
ncbi:adenylyltransferase/cytidyltransferase family protein [Shewanella sp. NIFS-20-20]|uniref:adenylyltransferase/cytidyltransferase family protein n=1 Tax=Shewanella sp. NIFS-20-20 TaxID=2853806 RepID=UPI001C486B38|nr:adenylyltransferase/cytidyltransferase family protein [Shewanella sp. NIFS-20-20]MBV7316122.1 adenylyltransferase/cytidyltransferase family protein [Shewanella sp. NIFS-20-20]